MLNNIYGSLTPIRLASGRAAAAIPVGAYPYPTAVALVPSSHLAVTVDSYTGRLSIINVSRRQLLARVQVGPFPIAVAFGR